MHHSSATLCTGLRRRQRLVDKRVFVELSIDASTRMHVEHTCPPSTGASEQSDKAFLDLCKRKPGMSAFDRSVSQLLSNSIHFFPSFSRLFSIDRSVDKHCPSSPYVPIKAQKGNHNTHSHLGSQVNFGLHLASAHMHLLKMVCLRQNAQRPLSTLSHVFHASPRLFLLLRPLLLALLFFLLLFLPQSSLALLSGLRLRTTHQSHAFGTASAVATYCGSYIERRIAASSKELEDNAKRVDGPQSRCRKRDIRP